MTRPAAPRRIAAAWLRSLPKTELHIHLEGTVTPETLVELSRRNDEQGMTLEEARSVYHYTDFTGFLLAFKGVSERLRTPAVATVVAGFLVALPSGLLDIGTLADLSNIGTLFAFVLVSIGVLILRYREPERRRGFRAPGGISVPILSIFFCVLLMSGLPVITWLRFFGWLVIGLVIYFLYSRRHSEFSSLS